MQLRRFAAFVAAAGGRGDAVAPKFAAVIALPDDGYLARHGEEQVEWAAIVAVLEAANSAAWSQHALLDPSSPEPRGFETQKDAEGVIVSALWISCTGTTVLLESDGSLTIGSGDDNDRIYNDPAYYRVAAARRTDPSLAAG